MLPKGYLVLPVLCSVLAGGCGRGDDAVNQSELPAAAAPTVTFGDDVAFLERHVPVVVLQGEDPAAQVAVVPAYQGRVMTSSANGAGGTSHGYLHRSGIEAGKPQPHMTVLGGEDRFWLGPEGGQFALYFPPGAPFTTDAWQVPQPIDWDDWPITSQTPTEVSFQRAMTVTNWSGTRMDLRVDRVVRILGRAAAADALGEVPASVRLVAYESDNTVTNTGAAPWRRETGGVSIWILGMFPPGPNTTVMLPFVAGPEETLGPIVNDAYFGQIPPERLRIAGNVIYFRGDGLERGKIGVPRPRARNVAGSYDPDRNVLTIVTYTLPDNATEYVNSMWEQQTAPYAGDVVNSYNDGPLGPGQPPLGPFYEIETSSPAALLAPGDTMRHVNRTFHFEGTREDLADIARRVLGAELP